jgi:hypothetical protein
MGDFHRIAAQAAKQYRSVVKYLAGVSCQNERSKNDAAYGIGLKS